MIQCPRCGIQVTELHPIDEDLSSKLQAIGEANLPSQVCAGCISDLHRSAANSSGSVLMAQERAKEQHRLQLWKSRVHLIKKARSSMEQRQYADAAINYEKYLKVLDIVFDVKKGEQLRPDSFKESARTNELTLVASVYWDLMCIYDTSSQHQDRMNTIAQQLSVFLQFTPIYPDIIRKAESFQKKARNPQIVKKFLKMSDKDRPRCFIATSAFESPTAPEVLALRGVRDFKMRHSQAGRSFIAWYYRNSPRVARYLDKHPWLKPTVRACLRLLIKCVS